MTPDDTKSNGPQQTPAEAPSSNQRPVQFPSVAKPIQWGLLAAGIVGALLWWFIPVEYEAVALLRVRQNTDEIIGPRGRKPTDKAYQIYKETQRQFLRDPFVLHAALRLPGISQLPMIREQGDDVVEWLTSGLNASTSPETQMIRVKLKGPNETEPRKIIDAVLQAYEEQILRSERSDQMAMRSTLERDLLHKTSEYKRKQEKLRILAADTVVVADGYYPTMRALMREIGSLEDYITEAEKRPTD